MCTAQGAGASGLGKPSTDACLSAEQPTLKSHLCAYVQGREEMCALGWHYAAGSLWGRGRHGFGAPGDSPSSVIVPLLEPPLLLDCRWDEEEDTEDSAVWPLGEGEGVRVGEVLLEVAEVPERGRLPGSSFCTGH